MSRMNAAWSNEPPWAEAVPAIFKEPMTIAFGGAILAHAIFFLGLPVVAGSEKQPDVQPVATTVLTDQERAAVPADLAQSQFSTGSLLPGSNNGLIVPSIPSNPATPGGTVTTPGLGSGFGQLNDPTFPNGGSSTGSNSSDNSDFNRQLAEITRKQQEADRQQQSQRLAQKQAAEQKADQEQVNTPPTPLPSVAVGAMPPGTPSGEPAKPNEGAAPNTPPPTTPAQQPIRLSDKTLIDKDPALYALITENTGPTLGVKLRQAIGTWYTRDPKTQEIYTRSDGKEQLERFPVDTVTGTIPYPKQVGKQDVAVIPGYAEKVKAGSANERMSDYGTAIVGIAVDGQGKRLIDPSIIQSTGHKILDDYAIEYVKSKINFRITYKDEFYYMVIPIDPPVSTPAQQATS
jgi:hypothetical protein